MELHHTVVFVPFLQKEALVPARHYYSKHFLCGQKGGILHCLRQAGLHDAGKEYWGPSKTLPSPAGQSQTQLREQLDELPDASPVV